jgi:hypothetical protein
VSSVALDSFLSPVRKEIREKNRLEKKQVTICTHPSVLTYLREAEKVLPFLFPLSQTLPVLE